jgi:hypothetical protein
MGMKRTGFVINARDIQVVITIRLCAIAGFRQPYDLVQIVTPAGIRS